MKISNQDGVSVTVATRAAAIRTSQGRRTPRQDRGSEVEAKARPRQFFWGRGKPTKYRDSWHETEASKFSASRQTRGKASATRTTSLLKSVCLQHRSHYHRSVTHFCLPRFKIWVKKWLHIKMMAYYSMSNSTTYICFNGCFSGECALARPIFLQLFQRLWIKGTDF